MQVYLVGGAIRDSLIGIPTQDKDWVVIGASPEDMLAKGFKPIGKDFPVFLHPDTNEEYALARTEKKTAKGYKGFKFYYDKNVTLEQDLQRRDLTINAIAQDENGELIDPFNGQQDIENRTLRHVSAAFNEDPVRILRIARFACKLVDFNVAPQTNLLMKTMVDNGEVDALVKERIWKELSRALTYQSPSRFFHVLAACDANRKLWPEISTASLQNLDKVSRHTDNPVFRLAACLQPLSHHDCTSLIQRLHVPNNFSKIAQLVNQQFANFNQLDITQPLVIHDFLQKTGALRQTGLFNELCYICDLITETNDNIKILTLQKCAQAANDVSSQTLQDQGLTGLDFAKALAKLQIEAIDNCLNT
jgi:tRNA nucleotidyltransferase (CCA-adding enzyme)